MYTYDSEWVSIDLSLPHHAVSRNRFWTALVGRKPWRGKCINLNDVYSLLGLVLPLLPHFTHISLTATALAQTLAQLASSTGGFTAALVATSSLHCLSPKIPCQIESQHELWEECMPDGPDSIKILDLREMRKYGIWIRAPACQNLS